MKTSLLTITLLAALSATPLLADDGMKCCCMKEHEAKAEMQKKMEAKMKAAEAELNALLEQVNSTTGEKKVEAMAALLNKMLQERKAMHEKMAAMHEKMAQEKKPEGEEAKPAEHKH
jgi:dipeptidase